MHPPLREFVFRVDTEEVLDAPPPPAPVFASPRRRASSPPTVALRLPDLRVATAPAGSTSVSSSATVSGEPPVVRKGASEPTAAPIMSLPTMPDVESLHAVASHDDAAQTSAAGWAPLAVAIETPPSGSAAAAPDADAFWKNPKFMLAGVAAAFLGMVSLMAMNHEPSPAGDDAPAWNGMNATASAEINDRSAGTQSTPLVLRGEDSDAGVPNDQSPGLAADLPPAERTASALSIENRYSAPLTDAAASNAGHLSPWVDGATGTERIAFDDELEGTARLVEPLPNFASPVEREAGQESSQADGAFR